MSTAEFKYLSRVMECQVSDRLFQPRPSSMLNRLIAYRYLCWCESNHGNLLVKWVDFTVRGHMDYCAECAKRTPDEEFSA